MSRFVAHNVVKEKTTADLMKALSSMYEKPLTNNKVHLMKELFNLKMVENASVAQHLNEFNTITNQLSSVEIDFDDEICKVVIYNYVLCWLYSMTKSVVIALILFLVFCGILLYWV